MTSRSNPKILVELETKIAELEGLDRTEEEEQRLLKWKLCYFFKTLVQNGWIRTLNSDLYSKAEKSGKHPPILHQLEKCAKALKGGEKFKSIHLKGLNTSTLEKLGLSAHNCEIIRRAFPKTDVYWQGDFSEMRELWNELVGPPSDWTPHFLKRLSREGSPPTDKSNCELIGDYLMFRMDEPGYARPAFFRFYKHEIGDRIRSMGLRLDKKHRGLSSKGWVYKQNKGYMIAGYIIKRYPDTTKPDGGFSLISVSNDTANRLVVARNGLIEMAPVLHMQTPFDMEATCSKGILIKLRGAENVGGQRNQTKDDRHYNTLELHNELIDRFGKRLNLDTVAKVLERATNIEKYFFALTSDMRPSTKSVHSGAFQNAPNVQERDGKQVWRSADFQPLKIADPLEAPDYDHFIKAPEEFGIDFFTPGNPFLNRYRIDPDHEDDIEED